ncbi:MAG: MgtC/SapB family protein [Hyphomicrobiales bacterium]|uniref:MgtC/SapB family protein n=1 Tax=Methylobacterium TaxID=407 RepID=UPI001EEFD36A|nr:MULTISPECIES: MgtC/SapB family protein [Methylobacterium]URD40014.1 MgtC/SapB family protein [Methylobacterium tardum]
MAACGFVWVAIRAVGIDPGNPASIIEGLATGVGFIGGGAVLQRARRTSGTATAESLWATGAVGAAAVSGLHDVAPILIIVMFLACADSRP